MEQVVFSGTDAYGQLEDTLKEKKYKKMLMVCGKSFFRQTASVFFASLKERTGLDIVYFSGFEPNPSYDSVCRGTELFLEEGCDLIGACGGGSAMDVAKCIRLFAELDQDRDYLDQDLLPGRTDLLVLPSTAGTGSEATHFAVIYREGKKVSVAEPGNIPGYVLFDPGLLSSLPAYQKKATLLDALCHAVESAWSRRATPESRRLSGLAIDLILENLEDHLSEHGDDDPAGIKAGEKMLMAANLAGKAINITTTTAGHAMSYAITKTFGIAHGHAAGLCVRALWGYMLEKGWEPVSAGDHVLGQELLATFSGIIDRMDLEIPVMSADQLEYLCRSVDSQRLQNHPAELDREDIRYLYMNILKMKGQPL